MENRVQKREGIQPQAAAKQSGRKQSTEKCALKQRLPVKTHHRTINTVFLCGARLQARPRFMPQSGQKAVSYKEAVPAQTLFVFRYRWYGSSLI